MMSLRPLTSRVASHVFGWTLADAAERIIEIAPRSCWPVDPPLTLPGEADRVVAHHADCVPAYNNERLRSRIMRQDSTRLHLVRDVIISDGTVLARSAFERIAPGERKFIARGDPEHIHEAALCSNYLTSKYFGHWLKEGVTYEKIAVDYGLQPLVLDREPWSHEEGYRELLSLHPRRTRLAKVDKLWFFNFFQFNGAFVDYYNRLREITRAQADFSGDMEDRIYLARGSSGTGRWLANRDEVQEALRSRGFTIIEAEKLHPRDLTRALARARLVVAPEGSALSHAMIAMPRGAGLLAIMGAQHFNMVYKLICNALDFKFGFVIADALDQDQFSQPLDRLLRAIDLVDGAIHKGPHGQVVAAS